MNERDLNDFLADLSKYENEGDVSVSVDFLTELAELARKAKNNEEHMEWMKDKPRKEDVVKIERYEEALKEIRNISDTMNRIAIYRIADQALKFTQ